MYAIAASICFVALLAFAAFWLWLRRQDSDESVFDLQRRVTALEQRAPPSTVDPEARALAQRVDRRLGIIAGFASIDLDAMEAGKQ
jgi:hypothetical protein